MSKHDLTNEALDRLSDIKAAYGNEGLGELIKHMRRMSPRNKTDFLGALIEDLEQVVRDFEKRRLDFQDATEDEISNQVKAALPMSQYATFAVLREAGEQGHVDITIRHMSRGFEWLGEAKLDNGPAYLTKGMRQLYYRYTSGNEAGSGMLIYNRKKNSKGRMATWREHLSKTDGLGWLSNALVNEQEIDFVSTHLHDGKGIEVQTRHLCFSLYVNPKAPAD